MECRFKDDTECIQPEPKSPFEPICRGCPVFLEVMTKLNDMAYVKIEADREGECHV